MKHSWLQITGTFIVLTVIALALVARIEGWEVALRCLPGFVFGVAWLISDLFWHLGLNRAVESDQLLPVIGWANVFTEIRGWITAFLLGRLIGGVHSGTTLVFGLYSLCVFTDICDGMIARITKTETRLGKILDAECDFCVSIVLAFILVQNGVLAAWIAWVLCLRFCLPLLAVLGRYFLYAQSVRFGSTLWGKCAGIAMYSYFFILLIPLSWFPFIATLSQVVLVVTLILLVVAPLAQFFMYWREGQREIRFRL